MSGSKHPGMVNAFMPGVSGDIAQAEKDMILRRQKYLGPAYRLFYEQPLHLVRGQGVWLYDSAGKAYLDAYNNVVPVGHCNTLVIDAITRQAGLLNTHTRYLHETILVYAERLLRTFPEELQHAMFTCTGSEANDLALRLAKSATGKSGIIVTELAYHGVTDAVAKISPSLGYLDSPDVIAVAAPDRYRSAGVDVGRRFADDVARASHTLNKRGFGVAALICDTIFSSDGILPEPVGFLKGAVDAVRESGGLFIADEVQAGFARTGEAMWGFSRHGVVPDIVTIGKPMGNGHPIAGVVSRPEIVEKFGNDTRYFNTFGGNPVSCAAALATLDVIESTDILSNVRDVGRYLSNRFSNLASTFPVIGDVRGSGLYLGVELVKDHASQVPDSETALYVVNELRRRGVLVSATGPGSNVLKIRPPLIFEKAHVDILVDETAAVLAKKFA